MKIIIVLVIAFGCLMYLPSRFGDSHTKVAEDNLAWTKKVTSLVLNVQGGGDSSSLVAQIPELRDEWRAIKKRRTKLGDVTRDSLKDSEQARKVPTLAATIEMREAINTLQASGVASRELHNALFDLFD